MDAYFDMYNDLCVIFNDSEPFPFNWSCKVSELEQTIARIKNPYTKKTMQDRYNTFITKAKKIPNDRAHSYNAIRSMVSALARQLIDQEN